MTKKQLIGFSILVILVGGVWFGTRFLPSSVVEKEQLPPRLSGISAEYVTSTAEVVIRWDVENVDIPALNTGVRYATTSKDVVTTTSETYPEVVFAKRIGDRFEARIDAVNLSGFFYRIQIAHNNEFLWSSEGEVLLPDEQGQSE